LSSASSVPQFPLDNTTEFEIGYDKCCILYFLLTILLHKLVTNSFYRSFVRSRDRERESRSQEGDGKGRKHIEIVMKAVIESVMDIVTEKVVVVPIENDSSRDRDNEDRDLDHDLDRDESSGDRDYQRSSGDTRRDGSRKRKRKE